MRQVAKTGDDAVEFIGACLSSHLEIGAHDCGSGRKGKDPIRASGGGVAIQAEIDDGMSVDRPKRLKSMRGEGDTSSDKIINQAVGLSLQCPGFSFNRALEG